MPFGLRLRKSLASLVTDSSSDFTQFTASERGFEIRVRYDRYCAEVHMAGAKKRVYRVPSCPASPPVAASGRWTLGTWDQQTLSKVRDTVSSAPLFPAQDPKPYGALTLLRETKEVEREESLSSQAVAMFVLEVQTPETGVVSAGGLLELANVVRSLGSVAARVSLPAASRESTLVRRAIRSGSLLLGFQAVGTLFHEIAHHLESDVVLRGGRSLLGKPVCDFEGLVVTEDPCGSTFGFNALSDEGVETRRKLLVQDGMVVGLLDSLAFPHTEGRSGYVGSLPGLPVPRTVNLSVVGEGGLPYDELLGDKALVLENIAASLEGEIGGEAALIVSQASGVIVHGGSQAANFSFPLDLSIPLSTLTRDNFLFSTETSGAEPGFCLKDGHFVRSTQVAPAFLVRQGPLRHRLASAICP